MNENAIAVGGLVVMFGGFAAFGASVGRARGHALAGLALAAVLGPFGVVLASVLPRSVRRRR